MQELSSKRYLPPPKKTSWVTADGWRVIIARGIRNFGYGFTSVLFGVTLAAAGFSTVQVGLLLTVALVGDIISIILVALFADQLGRRNVLAFFTLLMAAAGLAFAVEYIVDDSAIDAYLSTRRPLFALPAISFTNGCADEAGIYYGTGRA